MVSGPLVPVFVGMISTFPGGPIIPSIPSIPSLPGSPFGPGIPGGPASYSIIDGDNNHMRNAVII